MIIPDHLIGYGEREISPVAGIQMTSTLNDVALLNILGIVTTLDMSHFTMSTLNDVALLNILDSQGCGHVCGVWTCVCRHVSVHVCGLRGVHM